MAEVGDIRKTSNNCQVARRVPRTDAGCFLPSNYIAAIDFGTTNCSVAYILPGEMSENGPVMLPFDGTFYRVPTAILFNPLGRVKAFGTTARRAYGNLDDEERLEYAFFEHMKMNLQHEEFVNREMKVKASNNKKYYLVEVIAHILKYLKDELIRILKLSNLDVTATDFDWVITVPAIWRAKGKQMMREAGYKAGLCSNVACGRLREVSSQNVLLQEEDNSDKLTLVLEPEAAAFFCQTMCRRACADYCTAQEPFNSDNFLVVDVGGGTVDTVAYQFKEDRDTEPHIEVIHEPTGEPWGGAEVNEEFKKFLESLTGDNGFSRYVQTDSQETNAKHRAYLEKILNEQFEPQKTLLGNKQLDEDGKVSITLNSSFIKCYGTQIAENIKEINTAVEKATIRFSSETDELRISYSRLKLFFDPVVEGIIQCVANVLNDVPDVHTIYLVGGFGGCEYIHSELKSHFKRNYKFITPREKEHAVVRGAAMMKRKPKFIKARLVDATYGVRVRIPFVQDLHDEEYRCRAPGKKDMCSDIFATFVEKGDVVCTDYVYMKTFYPERRDQTFMRVQIYSSMEKDVWYTTGKPHSLAINGGVWLDVRKIGELKVPFRKIREDIDDSADRAVDVMFDFSTAEIEVTGCHHGSDTTFRLVLDFLGS